MNLIRIIAIAFASPLIGVLSLAIATELNNKLVDYGWFTIPTIITAAVLIAIAPWKE